jgi:hypothetical protein
MCLLRYELGFYIPENNIHYSHGRGNLKPYIREVICLNPYMVQSVRLLVATAAVICDVDGPNQRTTTTQKMCFTLEKSSAVRLKAVEDNAIHQILSTQRIGNLTSKSKWKLWAEIW